jgi:general secretion pathway protein K
MPGTGNGTTGMTPRSARGFIVIAVLWILAALSALVLIYLTYVTNTAVIVAGTTDRIQTEAMVTGGVELAALQLSGLSDSARPSSGTFNARLGAGRVFVTFRSEAARVDLNAAPKGLLSGLMAGLGVDAANAAVYADRIVAWRASSELGENDPENSFYKTSGVSYLPRHAPFPTAEELWLVHGIPSAVVARMLPFVTVFSNMAGINLADAAPQVLAALPGMTPENLQSLISQRSDPSIDPHELIGLSGGEGATLASSKAYRISVDVELADRQRSGGEVVILLLENSDEPYRVLSWRNYSDGSTAPQKVSSR